jgi:hypothetical protein
VAARSAPPPKGTAGGVKAKEHATNGAEQPSCSSPVRGLPRLSPGAAVPFLNDSTAAPLRSSQQWHARDGPSARDGPRTHRRSLHARTLRSPFQSKPSAARAGARGRNHGLALPERGCETLHPAAAARGNERGAEPAVEPSFFTPQGAFQLLGSASEAYSPRKTRPAPAASASGSKRTFGCQEVRLPVLASTAANDPCLSIRVWTNQRQGFHSLRGQYSRQASNVSSTVSAARSPKAVDGDSR